MRTIEPQPFKAGLVLEKAVAESLAELDIPHRRTVYRGREDVHDRLDFVLMPGGGRPNLEVQLTLRPKHHRKIFTFAHRALTTVTRGVRLYVEVVGSHRRAADLTEVGRKVATALTTIAERFLDFGPANLLGVRIHALTGKIEKFDLAGFCGSKLVDLAQEWREQQRRLREERLEAQRAAFRERMLAPRPLPFWQGILEPAVELLHAHLVPTKPSPPINTRHYFVPRRHC